MKKKQFYTEPEETEDRSGIRAILQNAKKPQAHPIRTPDPEPERRPRLHVSARGIGKNRKTIRKQLLFTPSLFNAVQEAAERAGLSINAYIADRLENAPAYGLKLSHMDSETKSRRVHIAITEEQAAELAKRAQQAELSENAYIAALLQAEENIHDF